MLEGVNPVIIRMRFFNCIRYFRTYFFLSGMRGDHLKRPLNLKIKDVFCNFLYIRMRVVLVKKSSAVYVSFLFPGLCGCKSKQCILATDGISRNRSRAAQVTRVALHTPFS